MTEIERQRVQRLIAEVRRTVGTDVAVDTPFADSRQSNCLKFSDQRRSTSWVLKIFDRAYPHASLESLRREVEALDAFSQALESTAVGATCPAPVAVYETEMAYLMTHFPGRLLHEESLDRAASERIAHTLVDAMNVYYRDVGPLYGDFHYRNVLIDSSLNVCLIDPTHANPFYRRFETGYQKGAADMGHWICLTCVGAVRGSLSNPGMAISTFQFASLFMAVWAAEMHAVDEQAYVDEVFIVCDLLLDELRSHSRVRGTLLFNGSKACEGLLRARYAHRRSRWAP